MAVVLRVLISLAEKLLLRLKALWSRLSTVSRCFIGVSVLSWALRKLRQMMYRLRIRRALNNPAHPSHGFNVIIVGAGFSGILMGIKLKQQGIHNFIIYDRNTGVGGTWFLNRYPGVRCDVASQLYSFSFEQSFEWSCDTPPGSEILRYLEFVCDKYQLRDHLVLCHSVDSAVYDSQTGRYNVTVRSYHPDSGELTGEFEEYCNALVIGTGQLNIPKIPDLPGLSQFRKIRTVMHTARWPEDFDPTGKKIGVIGTGPSGFQCAPALAPLASELVVFQRSLSHVSEFPTKEPRKPRSENELRIRRWFPIISRLERCLNFLLGDLLFIPILYTWDYPSDHWFRRFVAFTRDVSRKELIDNEVKDMDEEQRRRVEDAWQRSQPNFPFGCKRILLGKEWFRMFAQRNVRLVTAGIQRMTEEGTIVVMNEDGNEEHIELDAVVMATGFHSQSFCSTIDIKGKSGRSLSEAWKNGNEPYSYKGICISDYPNLFVMYGPYTNLASNSIIFQLECQSTFIIKCLRQMIVRKKQSLEVKHSVMLKFQKQVDSKLSRSVWSSPQCNSVGNWYINGNGRVVNNWAFSCLYYWYLTRNVHFDRFITVSAQ